MKLVPTRALAEKLMAEHGLTEKGWRFNFDKAKVRFGACHWATKEITLSQDLVRLNEEPRVKNTILHEIAHALAGQKAGHGRDFVIMARTIGCDGHMYYNVGNTLDLPLVQLPAPKYEATCDCEGKVHRKERLSAGHKRGRYYCNNCHAKLIYKRVQ